MKKLLLFLYAAFGFLLVSNSAFAQTPRLTYSSPNIYTVGVAVTLTPTNTGGVPTSCTVNIGALPAGLTISATGVISGTPSAVTATTNIRVNAVNGSGNRNSNTFTIQIVAAATLTYTNPAAYTVGTAIPNLSPTTSTGIATGGFGTGVALAGATLNGPYGMARDASGNIYVTNYGNNTVSEYNSAGTYVGVYGTGNPAYNQPSGIAFDASGNAYVANRATTGNGNVYKFNSSGVYQSTIITGLSRVYGITTDAAGNVYVADQNAGKVYKYSNTGTLLLTITLANSWNVAVDASGNIYILNGAGGGTRVSKYNSAGTLVTANYIAGFTTAYGLSIDSYGNMYVGDSGTGNVTQYNSTGTLITTITGLNAPQGMVADGKGDLYVSDYNNGTVTKYPPAGGYYITAGTLPAGLSFNSTTGTFSGTPTAYFASTVITVTGYNAAGTAVNANVTLSCNLPAPALTYSTPNVYTVGVPVTLTPTNTGGPATSCVPSVALPAGLTISATGVISGTPTAATALTNYTVAATNATGTANSNTFSITVVNPPVFSYAGPDIYTLNTAITALSPTITSGGPLSGATISPSLPAGLTMSAAGVISGTPTALSAATPYTITAIGAAGGTGTATVTISVVTAPVFSYASPQVYTQNLAITALSPTITSGGPLSGATIAPALPAGLSISAAGVISGTPTALSAAQNYTVTAYGANGGVSTAVVRISVVVAPVFSYASPQTYDVGVAITALSPTVTSGGPLSGATVTVNGPLPAGLSLSAAGVISGTPTAVSGPITYTITATGAAGGTGTATITITVITAPPALIYSTPNTYAISTAFTLTPTNTGSPVVSSTIAPALPAGVTMSATGVISGSSATAGTASYTVMATNAAGTTSSNSFIITFIAPPAISYSPSTNAYTVGVAIPTLTPTNTGGAVSAFAFGTGTALPAGTLNTPYGIGINPTNGDVYVTNSGSNTISYFTAAGAYVGAFSAGWNTPVGIVFDSSGNAYVADRGSNSIIKVTSGGVRSTLVNGFNSLRGIAIDASNNLYVANGFGNDVYKYSTAGALLLTLNNAYTTYPSGVAVDGSGDIYVLDRQADDVIEYNSSGAYVKVFATGFTGNGPYAIAVDKSGNVYVSDTNNNKVDVYNPAGTLLTTISGLNSPYGLVIDGSNNLYVVNQATPSVVKYPLVGGYTISSPLPAGLSFNTTTGAISGTPTVAFASTTYTITAYNSAGSGNTTVTLSCTMIPPTISYSPSTNVYTVGTAITPLVPTTTGNGLGLAGFGTGTALASPTGPAGFNTPQGIGTDASGNIYIADSNNGVIRKYSSAGAYLGTFGTGVPGGFNTPTGIVFDSSGNAYVVDSGNGVVYKLNSTGAYQSTLNPRGGGGWGSAFAIAIDSSNNLYVTDQFGGYVTKFTTSGVTLQTITTNLNQPGGIAIDASGNIYIEDTNNGQVYKYNSSGVYQSTIITGLNTPYGLAVDGAGNIYVGDSGTGTVTEYNSTGTLLTTVSGQTDPEGLFVDTKGDLYVSDATNNTVIKYPPEGGFYLSGSLPPGLSFSSTTGTFSGTPTAAFPVTTYTVTAYSYGVAATTTVTLSCTITTPAFHYTPSTNVYSVGTAITPLVPIVTAGNIGASGFSSGTALTGVALNTPQGIGVDASGNIYVADYGNGVIRKYSSAGVYIGTFATAGGHVTAPMGIVFDSAGNAYILNVTAAGVGVVYEYTSAGAYVATLNPRGGNGFISGFDIAIDASNNLYVTENGNGNIYKFTTAGVLSQTIATQNGGAPTGIVFDSSGNFYVADNNNGAVYKYSSTGTYISTIVNGLNTPFGLAIDSSGNLYVGDSGTGTITEYNSSGTAITSVSGLTDPEGLYVNSSGDVFATDATNNTLIEYTPTGGYTLSGILPAGLSFNNTTGTFSGTPTVAFGPTTYTITGYSYGIAATTTVTLSCILPAPVISYTPSTEVYCVGTAITALVPVNTGGPVAAMSYSGGTQITGATLSTPYGIGTDASGNIYVTNQGNGTIVKYTSAGVYSSVFATGLSQPVGIVFDSSGNAYVIDRGTTNVYKITPAGVRTTLIAGVNSLRGIAIDASNNLYITSGGSNRIYKYTTAGVLTTTFPNTYTSYPTGVAVSSAGNVYVLDRANNDVIEFTTTGTYVETFATGTNTAYGLSVDAAGNVYIADTGNNKIEVYNSIGTLLTTITNNVSNPFGLITDAYGNIYETNQGNTRVYEYVVTGNFSISPALPAGLAFNTATGAITGTPTANSAPTTYTVSCHNTTGVATTTINITTTTAPVITYTTPDVLVAGTPATLNPTVTGTPVSYSISPALPAGLSFSTTTGVISGTPTTVTAAANYVVTATNSCGVGTFTINITVNPALPIISYTTPDVYNVGTTITPLTPTNTGGAVVSWSISLALPAGLSFSTTTGVISGTPTAISANTNYTVTATNVTGSATCVVTIEVNSAAPIISYTTPDTYTVGNVIAPLVPTNTGAAAVTWSISPGLPSGLNFDTTTGIITGTPTVVSAAANYTVTATNAGGSGTFVINIACVVSGPVLSYTTPDAFPINVAITPLSPVNTGSAPTSYTISPGLPTGLSFNTSTGVISGTPTVTSAATTYTVTATDASSNTGMTTIVISCSGYVDWIGVTSTDWNDPTNWATGAVPTATDIAGIGVNQTFLNFPYLGSSSNVTNSVAAVVIGTSSNQLTVGTDNFPQPGGFVVAGGSTLNVTGAITYQSDVNSGLAYVAVISGTGTVTAAGINVIANTTLGTPATYNETMASSITSLTLASNVGLTSTVDGSGNALNATFNITGGTVSVAGAVQTNNAAGSTSTLAVVPATTATLQLASATALSGLSGTGTNVVSFNNPGATIEYSGAAQTYYTDANITGLATGVNYNSIKFSGSGVKSPTGTNANNLKIAGDFTNALTINDASDYIDLSLPNVNFDGTSQNIYGGNGTGTKFYNIEISTAGTTTIQSGAVAVASTGVLTMSGGSAVLAAGSSLLTLNSDVNGTATVAAIPGGCSITGTVNVQRFITGGALNYRGYRLASSPVYANNNGTSNIYSINYLINTVYLKGTAGVAGGFDASGNPNIYLFRENLVPSNATFTSGNFRGVNTLGTGITNVSYLIDIDGGPYNIPVGAGYMFFFRGDRSAASLAAESNTTYVPTNATLTATGTLNQGQVTASDWYTPASTNLGYTTISGTSSVEGYNLVGNPYASSIDWDQYQTTTSTSGIYAPNVNPFIYIIDPVNNNYNVYQAGHGGVGTIVASGSNIIPSGQGFMVQAANASAQLIFNESAKTNGQANAANGNLLMGHPPVAAAVPQYLHLLMLKDSVNTDGILINFASNTSSKYVLGEDAAYRHGNGTVHLSSMSSDNIALAINAMPLPNQAAGQTIIPLAVDAITDGTYQLQMEAIKSIPALYTIWLKDAYRKDSLDMRANSTYAFDILHSDTNSYGAHRFTLVMGENPALMIHLLSFGASKIQSGDQVVWTTENEQNYTNFTVERSTDGTTFNDLGGFPSSGQGTYSYLDKTPVNGANMYRLKIVDLNGTVSYSNIVTIMYANTGNQIAINGLMLYPNPTTNTINLSITRNQSTGTTTTPTAANANYNIEIVNNLGSVIKSSKSSSPLWQSDVSSLTPGTYFIRVTDISNNTVVGKSAFVKL